MITAHDYIEKEAGWGSLRNKVVKKIRNATGNTTDIRTFKKATEAGKEAEKASKMHGFLKNRDSENNMYAKTKKLRRYTKLYLRQAENITGKKFPAPSA